MWGEDFAWSQKTIVRCHGRAADPAGQGAPQAPRDVQLLLLRSIRSATVGLDGS